MKKNVSTKNNGQTITAVVKKITFKFVSPTGSRGDLAFISVQIQYKHW